MDSISSISALQALTTTPTSTSVLVLGYYNINDGGGGLFYWDSGSTDAPSPTVIQQSSPSTGRWKRNYDSSSFVNVKWFGAKGDNTNDDTSAFNLAINASYQVYVPSGTYKIQTVNLRNNQTVFGNYKQTTIAPFNNSVQTLFNVQGVIPSGGTFPSGALTFVKISGLQFYNNAISSNCVAVKIDTCNELQLENLIIDGFSTNIQISNSSNVHINKVRAVSATKNNLYATWNLKSPTLLGSWIFMTECEFSSGILNQASANYLYSVYIENYASVTLDKCLIVGNQGGGIKFTNTSNASNTSGGVQFVKDMTYIVINACDIDSNYAIGIRGEYCRNCVITNNWISSGRNNLVSGIDLSNCESSTIANNQLFFNGDSGIQVANCAYITIANNVCQDNGLSGAGQRAGIRSVSCNYNSLTGNICSNNQYGYTNGGQNIGITADGSSDHHVFSSNILYTNINTTDLYQTGSNNLIGLNQPVGVV